MSRQPKEPTWPFLCILACLFVLSAAAPRAWQSSLRARAPRTSVQQVASHVDADRAACDSQAVCATGQPTIQTPDQAENPSAADVETVGELILVAPNPRIAFQAEEAAPAPLESSAPADEVELLELLPPDTQARPADVADTQALPADVADQSQVPAPLQVPALVQVPGEQPASPTTGDMAGTTPPGKADDADATTVPGVSAISLDRVQQLAQQQAVVRSPIHAERDWTLPVSVFQQLEPLCWDCDSGLWARRVTEAVSRAAAEVVANAATARQSLAAVTQLERDGAALAEKMKDGCADQANLIRRVLIVLERRVSIWEKIADATIVQQNRVQPIDWEEVRRSIQEVRTLTANGQNGAAWRAFLDLDALAEIAARGPQAVSDEDLATARLALVKLRLEDVTAEQRSLLDSKQVADLDRSLSAVVTRPVKAESWVAWIEAYERTGSPSLGEQLALERVKLSLANLPAHRELARRVEQLYCGPNVRIAVTGYLLNRMLPDRAPEYQWVRDTVLGHPVRGRSRTSADVGLALIPDSHRMRAALTVDGLVTAWTSSTAGPATFVNDSDSEYSAVKEIELTPMGIQFSPAEVTADNQIRLRQVQTDFDGIPFLSPLVRSVARSQHEKSRPAIRRETNRKIQLQAEKQIDEEIDARLGELNQRLKDRLLDPLAAMSLRPKVDQAETTESRMSMQLNLAGPTQLGSSTPRPWAPSDSVLSFQIHQSALNNVLLGLCLDGQTMTVKQLRDQISERFNRPELLDETTEDDDAEITFAATDAARIDFEEGRVAVSLGVSRLRARGRQWRDFRVRAYYRPEASRQSAMLVRDGVVELLGPMRMGSQIALRSIFSKTFAKGRELPIIPAQMAADPRLQNLEVTQLTAEEGWFALAVGPQRIQPAMANSKASGSVK